MIYYTEKQADTRILGFLAATTVKRNKKTLKQKKENRRYSRVILTRSVRMTLNGITYTDCPLRNLSLGGMMIDGKFTATTGDTVILDLQEKGKNTTLVVTIQGKVVRHDHDSIAVVFTHMNTDSYMFLQTMILYACDDPIGVAMEFLVDFPEGISSPC